MVNTLRACYFDGVTSVAHQVTVIITPTYLEINFREEHKEVVLWKVSELKSDAQLNRQSIQLMYGEYPSQILEFENTAATLELLQQHALLHHLTKKSLYNSLIQHKRYILLLLVSFILLSLSAYFFLLPCITPIIVKEISIDREIQLGNTLYSSMMAEERVDSAKTLLVNEYWKKMKYESDYPVEITVIRSNEVNAFALPGGKIVVFDSILSTMTHQEQLAALLSHEFVHIKNRHSLNSLVSAYSGALLIDLLMGNSGSTINSIFQNVHSFVTLKYSRKLEQEADEEGMVLMYQHKISPKGMYELFQNLNESEKENNLDKIPEFLNNHPVISNRLSYSKDYADKHMVMTENKELDELFEKIKE